MPTNANPTQDLLKWTWEPSPPPPSLKSQIIIKTSMVNRYSGSFYRELPSKMLTTSLLSSHQSLSSLAVLSFQDFRARKCILDAGKRRSKVFLWEGNILLEAWLKSTHWSSLIRGGWSSRQWVNVDGRCYRPCNPTINSLFSFLLGVGVILFPFNRASPSNGADIKKTWACEPRCLISINECLFAFLNGVFIAGSY